MLSWCERFEWQFRCANVSFFWMDLSGILTKLKTTFLSIHNDTDPFLFPSMRESGDYPSLEVIASEEWDMEMWRGEVRAFWWDHKFIVVFNLNT